MLYNNAIMLFNNCTFKKSTGPLHSIAVFTLQLNGCLLLYNIVLLSTSSIVRICITLVLCQRLMEHAANIASYLLRYIKNISYFRMPTSPSTATSPWWSASSAPSSTRSTSSCWLTRWILRLGSAKCCASQMFSYLFILWEMSTLIKSCQNWRNTLNPFQEKFIGKNVQSVSVYM